MNLKEAFRYQNFLTNMFEAVTMRLRQPLICKTSESHNRSKADPNAIDEEIDKSAKRDFDCSIDDLVALANYLLAEKRDLAHRIIEAKHDFALFMDAMTSVNSARRSLQAVLSSMCRVKEEETIVTGQGYRFNVEGNQVPYTYEIVRKSAPDFDKAAIKEQSVKLAREADEVSAQIDQYMISVQLPAFSPTFDPFDSLDDIIEIFMDKQSSLKEGNLE